MKQNNKSLYKKMGEFIQFRKDILSFNGQLNLNGVYFYNLRSFKKSKFDALVVAGMGGSGLVGDVLKSVQEDINLGVPVILWKDYGLPKIYHKNPFFLFVSFSGNTEETLSGLNEAVKKKGNIAVITGGGDLEKIGKALKLPMAVFGQGNLTPRQSGGKMTYICFNLLKSGFPRLKAPAYFLKSPRLFEGLGRKIAEQIKNNTVIIYTDLKDQSLGYILKIKLNETAKIKSFQNVLPEMSHNEINSFEKNNSKIAAIFLRSSVSGNDKYRSRRTKKFFIVEKLLEQLGVKVVKIDLKGKNNLENNFQAMVLSDWISYYVAVADKVNPYETKIIENLKKLMKK
jgi:glucose/mannose-6-phosphate isomerase